MGLPHFISPPSPTPKHASTNTEKAVAQHRSAIRRQRTVRGTPNWALSEIRDAAISNRRVALNTDSDHEADLEATRADANMLRSENVARRRNYQNRHTLRDTLSYERRIEANELRRERLFPHAPAAPPTISDLGVDQIDIARHNARARQSYMDHYYRIHSELDRARRDSVSRSNSPPLPPYTPGFTPAHAMDSDIRSSSRRQSPERSSSSQRASARLRTDRSLGTRPRHTPGYLTPPRASRGTSMSDMIIQRGHRIRARDLPDGLGDRDRSISPDAPVDWDTLSVTLAPDPQAPSTTNSSFASANASTNPSTAIASAASSASDSHSSATSASDDSRRAPSFRFRLDDYRPPMSPGIGTRSIPDFSIPGTSTSSRAALRSRSPNPDLTGDGNCDSADEFDAPEANENINSTNNSSRNLPVVTEDTAEEDDLYELGESEARPHMDWDFTHDAIEDLPGEIITSSSRHLSLIDPNLDLDTIRGWTSSRRLVNTRAPSLPSLAPSHRLRERQRRDMRLLRALRSPETSMETISTERETETAAETDLDSETNTLGGMQRIVRLLAERRDIPDTWWAGAGLSRTAGRSIVRDREGDDDMRLEG